MSSKSKKVKESRVSKSKKSIRLRVDEESEFERVFEVRIRDLRERKGVKQKSFSISVKKGTDDAEYLGIEELKEKIKRLLKEDG
jgi:hypothetical protein